MFEIDIRTAANMIEVSWSEEAVPQVSKEPILRRLGHRFMEIYGQDSDLVLSSLTGPVTPEE